jgi:hypothetical protein
VAPANRAVRPSACGAKKRALSYEQVLVLAALNAIEGIYEVILASLTAINAMLDAGSLSGQSCAHMVRGGLPKSDRKGRYLAPPDCGCNHLTCWDKCECRPYKGAQAWLV